MIQEVFRMSTIGTVLTVVLAIITVVLAVIILLQSKRSAGLGAAFMIIAFIVNLVG